MKKITSLLIMLLLGTISYSQTTIFSENFDGGTLPADWVLNATDNSGNHLWTFGSGAVPGNIADFTTNAAIFDDDIAGNTGDHNRAWIYHNAVDVSSFNQITLEYEYAINSSSNDDGTLSIGLFDGSNWIIIRTYGLDTAPTLDIVDIAAALAANPGVDAANLFIGFVYDDIDGGWAWGAGIDNVVLTTSNVILNDAC